jgi:hypothetical protein
MPPTGDDNADKLAGLSAKAADSVSKLSDWQITGLSAFAICCCMLCLWMVFFFGRRLQSTAHIRKFLVDNVKNQELAKLLRDLDDARQYGLDPNDRPPQFFGPLNFMWAGNPSYKNKPAFSSTKTEPETPDQLAARKLLIEECERWEVRERNRYADRVKEAEQLAQRAAEEKVPLSLDVSILGGGGSFLLEYSTLIVIIFSILAFGILQVMKGQDIVPILAAIAGYVLGKSSKSDIGTKGQGEGPLPNLPNSGPKG